MRRVTINLADLKKLSILNGVDDHQMQSLLSSFTLREARQGEIVYSKTDEENKISFVFSGKVKLVEVNDKGIEVTKDIVGEDEIFGFNASMTSSSFEYAEVVTRHAKLIHISQNDFNEVMKRIPTLSRNYAFNLNAKIRRLEERYINLAMNDPKSRLLYILSEMATKGAKKENGVLKVENYLTQDELARMIFVSRQTLSRIFRELRNSGVLIYKRHQIEIRETSLCNY